MKDKYGNQITTREFFSRWKQGIRDATPFQLIKINLMGVFIMIIGIAWGLYATYITGAYWLFLILIGSSFLTLTTLISMLKQYKALKDLNKRLEDYNKLKIQRQFIFKEEM